MLKIIISSKKILKYTIIIIAFIVTCTYTRFYLPSPCQTFYRWKIFRCREIYYSCMYLNTWSRCTAAGKRRTSVFSVFSFDPCPLFDVLIHSTFGSRQSRESLRACFPVGASRAIRTRDSPSCVHSYRLTETNLNLDLISSSSFENWKITSAV